MIVSKTYADAASMVLAEIEALRAENAALRAEAKAEAKERSKASRRIGTGVAEMGRYIAPLELFKPQPERKTDGFSVKARVGSGTSVSVPFEYRQHALNSRDKQRPDCGCGNCDGMYRQRSLNKRERYRLRRAMIHAQNKHAAGSI